MNRKQKLGYTALGALIMMIGLAFGAIVSAPLVAQNNGTFDDIRCNKLIVDDKNGKPAIVLVADDNRNIVLVADKMSGGAGAALSSDRSGNNLEIFDDKARNAILLVHQRENTNRLHISNSAGSSGVNIVASDFSGNTVAIHDKKGEPMILLQHTPQEGNSIVLLAENKSVAALIESSNRENHISIYDAIKANQDAITLRSAKALGNIAIVRDRAGNVVWSAPSK